MIQQTETSVPSSLDDLIEDPLIRILMERDGVDPDALRRLVASVRDRRRAWRTDLAA